jgi:UDP-glucuronate 4-epimerase
MRIVVTGGAGFIGSHLCDALLARGDIVFCVDNFNDYYIRQCGERFHKRKESNIAEALKNPNFSVIKLDIRGAALPRVFPNDIDCVVHLAARAGVRASLENPGVYQTTNVEGTQAVLDAAYAAGVKRFVVASSSSVYGTNTKIPFSETDPTENTVSPYAKTKKDMEGVCRWFQTEYPETFMTLLRFFTVYGPRGRPDMAPYLFVDKITRGEPIKKFGDGTTLRDYTFVADIVDGIVKAIDKPFAFEIINLGNNKPVSLNEFIATVEKVVGAKAVIEPHPMQPGDVPATYADIAKAKKLLGWQPKTGILEGMRKFADWYRENEAPD